jgi:tRNA nucleotidyltransferase (CCA-adding enzyme)
MEVFNLKPGREIGVLKEAIKEAILEGEIHNDYESAYAFMMERAKKLGLVVAK